MGVDSLMALEFIRRVNSALGLSLPATAVFNYPTITALAAQIAKRLNLNADEGNEARTQRPVADGSYSRTESVVQVDGLQELSEEDVMRSLMEPGGPASAR
jgi:hypothetical protein